MKKILIVDDEEDLCHFVKRVLERTGLYEVIISPNPTQVFALCQNEKPDLVLLDIVMPLLHGTEIIRSLKSFADTQNILIIVTSGQGEMVYTDQRDQWSWQPNRPILKDRGDLVRERNAQRAAAAYGVDDYLAKPFSPQTLLQVVEEVFLRGRQDPVD